MLICFHLTKDFATCFRPERIVASFLHSMVLLPKVLFNHARVNVFFSDENSYYAVSVREYCYECCASNDFYLRSLNYLITYTFRVALKMFICLPHNICQIKFLHFYTLVSCFKINESFASQNIVFKEIVPLNTILFEYKNQNNYYYCYYYYYFYIFFCFIYF